MSRTLLGFWLMLLTGNLFGSEILVNVNLFTGYSIQTLEMEQAEGRYLVVQDGNELTTLALGTPVTFRIAGSHIEMIEGDTVVHRGRVFHIAGIGLYNSFLLRAGHHEQRHYDDHLILEAHGGAIRMTNHVELEKYVAGVIQAEAGGSTRNVEYFMVQAMVCRTYAMRLIMQHGVRHRLTDDVSNQVYKGKPVTPEVIEAVQRTTGQVILHDDSSLINAVFHSNSGGFTMASEDVWQSSLPYLRPVVDTFAIGQRNYTWTHRMPVVEWVNYLSSQWNFPIQNDSLKHLALNYSPESRQRYFLHNIPLTHIRRDLRLKSTFFEIELDHDEVVFHGRGFGHGVGLSQEGGIRMADLGYSAYEILQFYYAGVHIRSLNELQLIASVE